MLNLLLRHSSALLTAALVVHLAANYSMLGVRSQGILSEEEAAYVHPKQTSAKRLQPEDPVATLLRNTLPSSRIIAGRGGHFPINETVHGRSYVGDLVVQKGLLEGLARVTHLPCARRQPSSTRLVWSHVTARFKFRASVNGVRVLGVASVQLQPAAVDVQLVGPSVKTYRVPVVRASSPYLPSLNGLVRLKNDVSRQLAHASQAALRAFLAGEARKVAGRSLERLRNDATPISIC